MEWTEDRIETLRSLWMQGLTASQIAERLGSVSRNAVIGKAHRLGVSARPSPIKRETARTIPLHRAPAAPPAAAAAPVIHAPAPPAPQPPVHRSAAPQAGGGSKTCMWPVGDPKQSDFHFCGAQAEAGRPYCSQHCAAAYHKRSVDAA
jgi:GcrA cell cycle regulator